MLRGIRHLLSLALVAASVAALVTTASPQPAAAVGGFGDIKASDFYAEAVQWMAEQGITSGTLPGCFSPEASATRGEVATFLHRANGLPSAADPDFRDVAASAFYSDAVGWMTATGITLGTTPTTFSPDAQVTRGELATFLYRDAGSPSSSAADFVDVPRAAFFADAVAWMVDEGITTGTTERTFSPERAVTRGEIAAFLYRAAGSPNINLQSGGDCALTAAERELSVAESASVEMLNDLRTNLGLDPLDRVSELDAAARNWSATMGATGNFVHSGLPFGENIAWWSAGWASPEEAADKMHELWVNSPGHYRNMTLASYEEIGIGFFRSDGGGWYATHVFDR